MKKGVALLITIALVAAIAALIGVSTGIVNQSFKRISNKQLGAQANLFFHDFVSILNTATQDVNDSMGLDIMLELPLQFESRERPLGAEIVFVSAASTVNVNQMLEPSEEHNASSGMLPKPAAIKTAYETYLNRILSVYNVSDKLLLLSMIADTVDEDLDERTPGSEIALESIRFAQGRVYDRRHFGQILDAYKRQTFDYGVDDIPWENLIGFDNAQVDMNHIASETLAFLVPEFSPEELVALTDERVELLESFDALGLDEEIRKRLEGMNVTFFSPEVRGTMRLKREDEFVSITFAYNLQTDEVSDVDMAY